MEVAVVGGLDVVDERGGSHRRPVGRDPGLAFSEALRAELVTTKVGLTVVFPGAIHTNITAGARGGQAAQLAEMGRSRLAPYVMRPPSVVARKIVSAVERDRARVVVGPDAHVVSGLTRMLPGRSGLVGRLTSRLDR